MIYNYTSSRALRLKKLMAKIPTWKHGKQVVFNYGKNFRFIFKGHVVEVSHYDQEIIIRSLR